MEQTPNHSLIRDLIQKNDLFDFATDYYFSHPKPTDTLQPVVTKKDFHLLMDYLKKKKTFPKSTAELNLEKAYEKAGKENQPEEVLNKYEELLKTYQQVNENILRQYQAYILDEINYDLIKRYFGEEGYTTYILRHDPEILKAKEILNDEKKYNKILGKK